MIPAHRIRVLLIALAAAVLLGMLFWPEAAEPRRLGINWRTPPAESTPRAAPAETIAASNEPETLPTYSDSEHVENLKHYGVIAKYWANGYETWRSDTASYYVVTLRDSTRSLSELGFIRGTALLDTSSRFTAIGNSGAVPPLRLLDPALVESRMRVRSDGCDEDIPAPMRRIRSSDAPWLLGLADGGADALPPGMWQAAPAARLDSSRRADVLHLARSLPLDSLESRSIDLYGKAFDAVPMRIETHYRFTADGAEILIAEVRRSAEMRLSENGKTHAEPVEEQRVFIAERDAADPTSAFRLMWQHYGGGYSDDVTMQTPILVLRVGNERLLTVYTWSKYKEASGGIFVSRTGKAKWEAVASWIAGC